MKLFIYRGKVESESKMQAELIKRCLRVYITENCTVNKKFNNTIKTIENTEIQRTSKGKPYVEADNLEFSISHSGNLWTCLVSDVPVGVDIQKIRAVDAGKLAVRFFTEGEQQYIAKFGKESFFDIWVRKEAYVKYTGTGISEGLSTFAVADAEKLYASVDNAGKYYFYDIHISPEIKCSICSDKIDDIDIVEIE